MTTFRVTYQKPGARENPVTLTVEAADYTLSEAGTAEFFDAEGKNVASFSFVSEVTASASERME